MKIALLHPSLTLRGGAERQILKLAIDLQKLRHEVELFTCGVNSVCYPEMVRQIIVHEVRVPIARQRNALQFKSSFRGTQKVTGRSGFRSLAGNFKNYYYNLPAMVKLGMSVPKGFDLINNHNTPTQWAAFIAKKRLKAPIVWMCNEPPFWFTDPNQRRGWGKINAPIYEGLDKVAVDYVDHIVTISKVAGHRIEKAYQKPYAMVRPGVDLFNKASGKKFRTRNELENDFVILQVGNIAPDKRQIDSLTALRIVAKNHSNVKLIFVGAGSTNQLVTLSRQWGIEDKVMFLRNCSDEELASIYDACDVFAFPSQITWGLAVLEAMSASKPVLVSDQAGTSEIISNGENGFVIKAPYFENMALQIEKLINKPELGKRIGENAYEHVKDNFSWETYAKNMELVFEKAVNNYKKR